MPIPEYNYVTGNIYSSEVREKIRRKLQHYKKLGWHFSIGVTSDPDDYGKRTINKRYNRLIAIYRTSSYNSASVCKTWLIDLKEGDRALDNFKKHTPNHGNDLYFVCILVG